MKENLFAHTKSDVLAGLVVFLVALPLCLGIALASGAPLFGGIIAGIIGGIVVGSLSGSALGVSGPAAGLTVIVFSAIQAIGDYQMFLMAVVLAGIIQLILAWIGAGKIAFYFPSSVIKGMLAAIGIIIILKQLPHAFGLDKDYEGDFSFFQSDGENTFSEILNAFNFMSGGALLISGICLAILILFEQKFIKKIKALNIIPPALISVILGTVINILLPESIKLSEEHLVKLPVSQSFNDFFNFFTLPKWEGLSSPFVWKTAFVLAIIASIETLLCVEATDKLDPEKRITPANRELFAQGIGNIVSGLIGGIPVTQVVVRSTANLNAGAKTKIAAVYHGIFLLVCVIFIPTLLNKIPYSALAAVLIMVGYKLAKPSLFKEMYGEGFNQFIPFVITIIAIVSTDLLWGIGIGLCVGLIYVLYYNFKSSVSYIKDKNDVYIKFKKDVFFYNRADLVKIFTSVKAGDSVYIDGSSSEFIDYDIFQTIEDFDESAKSKGITVELKEISRRKLNYRKSK